MAESSGIRDEQLAELAEALLVVARRLELRAGDFRDIVALNRTEIAVVREVHRNPGITPTELATITGLRRSNLSTAIRVLEARGLVTREQADADGRAVRVRPTAHASADLERVRAVWVTRLRGADAGTLRELIVGRDALERLAEQLSG